MPQSYGCVFLSCWIFIFPFSFSEILLRVCACVRVCLLLFEGEQQRLDLITRKKWFPCLDIFYDGSSSLVSQSLSRRGNPFVAMVSIRTKSRESSVRACQVVRASLINVGIDIFIFVIIALLQLTLQIFCNTSLWELPLWMLSSQNKMQLFWCIFGISIDCLSAIKNGTFCEPRWNERCK